MQRSVQLTERLGFKGAKADTLANMAVMQAQVGNFAKARELANQSMALAKDRSNLLPVALALAMTGDTVHAQSIMEDLDHRFPSDTLLHQVGIPEVKALSELNRKNPDQAIQALQSAMPYELAGGVAFLPTSLRGQAYLQQKRGPDAAAEFQKIIDHRGINPTSPDHPLAKLGLGRAYAIAGDNTKARAAYQDFLALWKDADADLPLLKEAKAEYAKLQ
jgi:eukaryotic-like serine/threonine-protein kinase